jgi:hypothetical protein
MNLYQEISEILPYFQSIRKLKNYLSIDVQIPNTWKLPKKYVEEDKVVEQENGTSNFRLISFVCEINEESVEKNKNNLLNIIKYNLEREEKEKLFEEKVNELKMVFEKQPLESLQNLKFQVKSPKIKLEDDENEVEPAKMV